MKSAGYALLGLLLFCSATKAEPTGNDRIRIYISGAIKKIGSYDVPEKMAFIAAISGAGGPGDFADLAHVKIFRPVISADGTTTMKQIAVVNYNLIIDGKRSMPVLKNGDVISIPIRADIADKLESKE